MASARRRHRITALLALAFACETGSEIHATITVPAEIGAAYSEANRGLLLVLFRPEGFDPVLREVAVLCGESGAFEVSDFGDGERPAATVTAWIEPVSGRACGPLGGTPVDQAGRYVDADEPQADANVEAGRGCADNSADISLELAVP